MNGEKALADLRAHFSKAILDAVTARVLAYRPPEAEAKRREKRRERVKDQDDRKSSI